MTDQREEAIKLAEMYDHGDPLAHSNAWKTAVCTELRRLHAREVELEAELVNEASRTANQKTRADQMSIQHNTQAALNRDARNQLAQLTAQLEAIGAGGVESLRKKDAARTRTVDSGALQMVVNALRRDASEGKAIRGEMADELEKVIA